MSAARHSRGILHQTPSRYGVSDSGIFGKDASDFRTNLQVVSEGMTHPASSHPASLIQP
jgi:hypothetical protein